jgi:hypothetical protein
MTSSQVVRLRRLDQQINEARLSGNMLALQHALAEKRSLLLSAYGRPA